MQVICKYYAILYKGLERVDSDSEGSRTNPLGIPKDNYISLFTMYDNFKNTL